MALTPSEMIPLGSIAPDFTLFDAVSETKLSLAQLKSDKATVIMFICNHCPFVKHLQKTIIQVSEKYIKEGVSFIAICSNDIADYPEDAPDKMKEIALEMHYPFPYLFDETQRIAQAYHAACTPDFYIYDQQLTCVYRGRFDDSTPGKDIPVTGKDLCAALDNILAQKPVDPHQLPSHGCNIKWKKHEQ